VPQAEELKLLILSYERSRFIMTMKLGHYSSKFKVKFQARPYS
jgi:hypothetical protein